MSNTTTALRATLAMAMTLAVGVPSAEALGNNGLSSKQANQVRNIVKMEVAKIPRGPLPMLFAFVFPGGTVDPAHSNGITDENVVYRDYESPPNPEVIFASYCFIGLPPVRGGQVTGGVGDKFGPYGLLELRPSDETCPVRVILSDPPPDTISLPAGFHVLLY